ncbi:MAG: ribosome silencing factor [Alphaproteobacteria bacterium]|nr:ribosome silencing factor [Alphaproteobacteria bacterium]
MAPKKVAAKKPAPRKPAPLKLVPAAPVRVPYRGAAADLVNAILTTLEDAKAENTVAINLEGRSTMADAMVVTTGRVNRHVAAIADQLLAKLKDRGTKNIRVEGLEAGDWCLVDTGDVIVHIFRPEVRAFYNLEKLWSLDAPKEHH